MSQRLSMPGRGWTAGCLAVLVLLEAGVFLLGMEKNRGACVRGVF